MDLKETRKITTVVDFLTAEIWYESENVFLKDMAISAFQLQNL